MGLLSFLRKKKLILQAGLSITAVFVANISTYAWFQVSMPDDRNGNITNASLNFTPSDVTAYKFAYNQTGLGSVDYEHGVAVGKSLTGDALNGITDQADTDPNLDVPSGGAGYYLIQGDNTGGSYVFNYTSCTYIKLDVIDNDSNGQLVAYKSNHYFAVGRYQFKQFSFYNGETVNEQISISSAASPYGVVDGNITISAAGYYNIWLSNAGKEYPSNKTTWKLTLETPETSSTNIGGLNHKSLASPQKQNFSRPTRKNLVAGNVTTGKYRFNILTTTSSFWTGDDIWTAIQINNNGNIFADADTDLGTAIAGKSHWRQINLGGTNYYYQTIEVASDFATTYYGPIFQRSTSSTGAGWYNKTTVAENAAWANKTRNTIVFSTESNTEENNGKGKKANYDDTKGLYFKVALHTGLTLDEVSYSLVHNANYSPADPVAPSGYRFDCWSTDPVNRVPYSSSNLSGDLNLYARYVQTTTVYFFPGTSASSWSNHYCYMFGDNINNQGNNNGWPGGSMTSHNASYTDLSGATQNYTYYSYTFDNNKNWHTVIFNNNASGNANQTVDIPVQAGKYFVCTGPTNGDSKITGNWYTSLGGASTTKVTYHLYDKEGALTGPKAKGWVDQSPSGTLSDTRTKYVINWEMAWNDAESCTSTARTNAYDFQLSEDYTCVAFQNSAGNKSSQNLTGFDGLTGHSGKYLVLDGFNGSNNFSGVEWRDSLKTVSLRISYVLKDGNNSYVSNKAGVELAVDDQPNSTFTPSITKYNDSALSSYHYVGYADPNNRGIWYVFRIPSTNTNITWYKNEACTTPFTNGNTLTEDTLYLRAECNVQNLFTFYFDTLLTTWDDAKVGIHAYIKDGDTTLVSSGSKAKDFSPFKISDKLFRVTAPNDCQMNITAFDNGEFDGKKNWLQTDDIALSGHTSSFLYIGEGSGGKRPFSWRDDISSSGSATAIIYDGTTNQPKTGSPFELKHGDKRQNDWFHDTGIDVNEGDYYILKDNNGTKKGFDLRLSADVTNNFVYDTSEKYIEGTKAVVFKKSGRFAFYWVSNTDYVTDPNARGKISVAEVPGKGNGYYLTTAAKTYDNAVKMNQISGSTYVASYEYYASQSSGTTVYLHSYIDGVEKLYKNFGDVPAGVSTNSGTGAITLAASKYYKFLLSKSGSTYTITIEEQSTTNFLALNTFDNSKMDTEQHVKDQNTSLVFEIKVAANNPGPLGAALNVTKTSISSGQRGLSDYVRVGFSASVERQGTEAYSFARSQYSRMVSLSSTSTRIPAKVEENSQWVDWSLPANTDYFYAYVIIDYKYGLSPSQLAEINSTNLVFDLSFTLTVS